MILPGHIGVVGVLVPQDPNAQDKLERRAQMAFDVGMFWFKGQKVGTGQCAVKAYNRFLRRLIEQEKVKPSGSCRTSCRWRRHRRPTGTSMSAGTAGPRSH